MHDPQAAEAYRAQTDANHLRILSLSYFIAGGLYAFGALPLIKCVVSEWTGRLHASGAATLFWVLCILGVVLLPVVCGICLNKRKCRGFCIVVAALSCLKFPFGTALGVFTIIVLCRPSVIALFEGRAPGGYLKR
ncbi:hypothetical protein [Haloferula sp. BvORR071]|uniref:hypothetical protein n=1 Tax=Haloferula sp. BvORR071 TaxID=1396141 RepID=UPI002240F71F|nr:hypothetical protein [Haloferula sp. BvORR071]